MVAKARVIIEKEDNYEDVVLDQSNNIVKKEPQRHRVSNRRARKLIAVH